MATHSITIQYAVDGALVVAAASAETDEGRAAFSGTIAGTTTNRLINVAFPYANVKSLLLFSDQDISLFTNATDGTGGDTFTLKAGEPQVWNAASGLAKPLAHDVTKFYGDNAGSTVANVKIEVSYH